MIRTRSTEGQLVDVTLEGEHFFIQGERAIILGIDSNEDGVVIIASIKHTVRLTVLQLHTLIGIEENDVLWRVEHWMKKSNHEEEMTQILAAKQIVYLDRYRNCSFPDHTGPVAQTKRCVITESIEHEGLFIMVPICTGCYQKITQAEFTAKYPPDQDGVIHTPFITPLKPAPLIYPVGDE